MSRKIIPENENVTVITGSDHAIGGFVDVLDKRYARSTEDQQGEGYVFEWSSVFGISTNLIEATEEDIKQGRDRVIQLCNIFCEKHNLK